MTTQTKTVFGVTITPELIWKAVLLAFSLGVLYAKLNAVGDLLAQKIEAIDKRVTRIEATLDKR